ncbi:kinesin-like protein KIFC3 [Chiloscyllium plagiosum]|uniref:kinesin-like protein KIFC3 n=1 Tax=Chiloscyllium plagiosum TaxID=36176 RepID=UPI001CB81E3B|nr:kinesin-like protein KIFC3 [Chiloscyllium plagiosum]
MNHLLSFLEQYSHMQRLQDRASEYKSRLRREEARSRKKRKLLRSTCKQELRDKLSLIENLQEIIDEQRGLVQKLQQAASKDVADPGEPPYSQHPLCPDSPPPDGHTACGSPPLSAGVQRLVDSIQSLQTERSKLLNEVESIKMEVEQGENEKRQLSASFETQIHCLREQVREHEEELIRLRTETGVTDSEKRIQHLSLENESLKENLRVTQGVLQQLSTISRHPSEQLLRENEELRSKVCLLESSVQQKLEQLLRLDAELSELQWRRETEDRHHQETVHSLQLQLHQSQEPPTHIQYVSERVEGNSEVTLGLFRDWEHRNRELLEQVTLQEGQLHKLEQQLQDSEETRSQLQYKVPAPPQH